MISLVIPVYNEKASLEELLRRVVAVDMPKELIVIDDCSTDGSREILSAWPSAGSPVCPAPTPPTRTGWRCSSRSGTRARARRSAGGSQPPPATWSSCRTRTWNTTRARLPGWWAHPRRARRRGVRQPLHRRDAAGALLLARGGELGAHHALQHDLGPEPDGHGDLLQGLPPRGHPVHPHRGGPLRLRAGDHRQGGRAGGCGSTRCRSATTAAPTRKGRRSAGRTGSARSTRSPSTR